MPTCEHFVYTTAKTDVKTGYQIVAKSSGINDRILNSMISYFFPLGVDPMEFTKSKSLLPIGGEHIAYSIVKNIGIGIVKERTEKHETPNKTIEEMINQF